MILVSAILVLAAIGLLIAGVVVPMPELVIASIAVSVLSTVFLLIGAFLRRKELFGGAAPADSGQVAAIPAGMMQSAALAAPPVQVPPGPSRSWAAAQVPREKLVFVVPGRKRYHLDACSILEGREREELTREEAREEGFSPCTTCEPDGPQPATEDGTEQEAEEKAAEEKASVSATPVGPADSTDGEAEDPKATSGGKADSSKGSGSKWRGAFKPATPPTPTTPATPPVDKDLSPTGKGPSPKETDVSSGEKDASSARKAAETAASEPKAASSAPDTEPPTVERPRPEPGVASTGPAASGTSPTAGTSRPTAETSRPSEGGNGPVNDAVIGYSGQVKVITGTRRYHSSECPLIKGADETGIETMTKQKAEASGLTHCSVCRAAPSA